MRVVREGVEKAHIIDGRKHHIVLLELLTDDGVGTMIRKELKAAEQDFVYRCELPYWIVWSPSRQSEPVRPFWHQLTYFEMDAHQLSANFWQSS